MPPWSNLSWYWNNFQSNAETLLSITAAPLFLMCLLLTGLIVLYEQKRLAAAILIWIAFFILLASSLGLYPTLERMVLFLIPLGILLIGVSLNFIGQYLRRYQLFSGAVLLALGIYLFWGAFPRTVEQFISPKYLEHIRPAMDYLQGTWQDGDSMYISNGGVPAFEYYAPMYGLENATFISGERDDYSKPESIINRLEPLKGQQRVWVLMSHVYEKGNFNEHDFLVEFLKENGVKKRVFIETGTSVYLYLFDLSQ
ncbi:MAG TPA: hypothetical protein DCX53_11730 [Anaerolineae bacterium]|nr:hypothetical protein [Anaerolineae bacterium]